MVSAFKRTAPIKVHRGRRWYCDPKGHLISVFVYSWISNRTKVIQVTTASSSCLHVQLKKQLTVIDLSNIKVLVIDILLTILIIFWICFQHLGMLFVLSHVMFPDFWGFFGMFSFSLVWDSWSSLCLFCASVPKVLMLILGLRWNFFFELHSFLSIGWWLCSCYLCYHLYFHYVSSVLFSCLSLVFLSRLHVLSLPSTSCFTIVDLVSCSLSVVPLPVSYNL